MFMFKFLHRLLDFVERKVLEQTQSDLEKFILAHNPKSTADIDKLVEQWGRRNV